MAAEVFHREVFPEELSYIQGRWAAAGSERAASPGSIADPSPTVKHGLVGLALSGGGIRSATFNLGLLQALQRRGILRHVDYLSTVSGGGFMGGALTSLSRTPGSRFPFATSGPEGEASSVTYLRNHCNYLAPRGLTDYARMAGLLFRGILLNMVILMPLIVVASVGVAGAYRHRLLEIIERNADASPWSWVEVHWLTPWAMALGVVWTLLFPAVSWLYRVRLFRALRAGKRTVMGGLRTRELYERTFGGCLMLTVLAGALDFQPIFVHYFHRWHVVGGFPWAGVSAALSVVASLAAGRAMALLKEHGRIVGLVVGGLLGPLLPFVAYLYLTHALVYGGLGPILGVSPSVVLVLGAVVVFLVLFFSADINATSMHGFYRDRLSRAYIIGQEDGADPKPEDEVSLASICQVGSGAPYHLFNATLNLQGAEQGLPPGRLSDYFVITKHFMGSTHTGYARTEHVLAGFPFVHLASAVAISGAAAAPNMGAFTNRALVFLMAALNIRLGYWVPNPRRVAAIVARSGPECVGRRLWRPGPTLLLREMLSRLDAEGEFVNVSDGGHLENTGMYELLRRRCRFIVASDVEGDPEMAFHGLADLMRYARIDLGVEIEMRLDDFILDAHGSCKQHCALGRIRYPALDDGVVETGYLLYVKASLTRDEDGVLAEYRARSPLFPHEPTADQFFDERQFEAYRSLGYHAVDGLFEPIEAGVEPHALTYPELADWFIGVELALAPRAFAVDVGDSLAGPWSRVEEMLRAPALAFYAREVYPELGGSGDASPPPEADRARLVMAVAQEQVRLMERVFRALDLDQPKNRDYPGNRGWMNLLRRWAAAPSFRRAFVWLVTSYSTGFQHFCKHALGLAVDYVWAPVEPAPLGAGEVAALTSAPAPGEGFVLSIREPSGASLVIGDASVDRSRPGLPRVAIRLHPGFDSADLRRAARRRLDRTLAGDRGDGSPR
jgi:hypothetical protein